MSILNFSATHENLNFAKEIFSKSKVIWHEICEMLNFFHSFLDMSILIFSATHENLSFAEEICSKCKAIWHEICEM